MELNNDSIIHDDHPMIRQKSANVPLPLSAEDEELLSAMYAYVKDSQDDELCEKRNLSPAVGLAAVQVGVLKKMIAVVVPMDDGSTLEWALVNPKIISKSTRHAALSTGEGCLSVPELHEGLVYRPESIKVRAYDLLTKQNVVIQATGYAAIVLQHEIDHLSGILYYDHIGKPVPEGSALID
ncbi:peptide deformylase [Allobaculum mucilyticum]|uniref:peptide deformylase n=1 Tax=Allobaculum mucilyticum TaxID=2834459 RepID=UPI001E5A7A81|nr:peptide deformylase [Allobaculum mucilyticum]UNT95365.1 peptide deformylase [Allobaculum mucilyticum]